MEGWPGKARLWFSPGGRYLRLELWSPHRLRVWDVSETPPRQVLELLESELQAVAYHPDGRHLLVLNRDGSLRLHDLQAPEHQPVLLAEHLPLADGLGYALQGDRLAALTDGKVQILDAKTGTSLAALPEEKRVVQWAWHPGGNYLAVGCGNQDIHVWDLKRRIQIADLNGPTSGLELGFTSDGERLLTAAHGEPVRLLDCAHPA